MRAVALLWIFGSMLPAQVAKPTPSSGASVFLDANAGGGWASQLCASPTRLYWVSVTDGIPHDATIRTAPTAGGAFQVIAKVPYRVQRLACGATGVSWVEHDEDGTYRLIYLPDGGAKRVLEVGHLTGKPGGVWWLGMNAEHVYWLYRDEENGVIRRAALPGGAPEVVVADLVNAQNAALDRNNIYISCYTLGHSHPRLLKAPIGRITDRKAVEIAQLLPDPADKFSIVIKDLAADGLNLYWVSNKANEFMDRRGVHRTGKSINEIQSVSKSGGTAAIVHLTGAPTSMVRLSTAFAFIDEKNVVKMESGRQKRVYQAESNEEVGWMATDGRRVYWMVTSNDNQPFRTVKSVIYSVSLDHPSFVKLHPALTGLCEIRTCSAP
jgi:hypothetical protein